MTWGTNIKQNCMDCNHYSQCYVRRELWNIAGLLTAVDTMPDGTMAPGTIEADCKGFKPKENK